MNDKNPNFYATCGCQIFILTNTNKHRRRARSSRRCCSRAADCCCASSSRRCCSGEPTRRHRSSVAIAASPEKPHHRRSIAEQSACRRVRRSRLATIAARSPFAASVVTLPEKLRHHLSISGSPRRRHAHSTRRCCKASNNGILHHSDPAYNTSRMHLPAPARFLCSSVARSRNTWKKIAATNERSRRVEGGVRWPEQLKLRGLEHRRSPACGGRATRVEVEKHG